MYCPVRSLNLIRLDMQPPVISALDRAIRQFSSNIARYPSK